MIELLLGNIWPVISGVLLLIAGAFGLKSRYASNQAKQAEAKAVEAERQADEARTAAAAKDEAHAAIEKVRKKPLKKPAKDRSDFEI